MISNQYNIRNIFVNSLAYISECHFTVNISLLLCTKFLPVCHKITKFCIRSDSNNLCDKVISAGVYEVRLYRVYRIRTNY